MAQYTPKTWATGETITAAELNAIEQAAAAAAVAADVTTSLAAKVDSSTYTTGLAGKVNSLVPTATKTAAYTAAVGDLAMMNVAGGGATLTLPTAPADKSQVGYRAISASAASPLTVNRGGSDTIGTAGATSATVPLADETLVYQYDAPNTRWLAVSNVKTKASLDAAYVRGAAWASLPMNWDATWKAALAASATTPAHVMFLGDSVVHGSNASAPFTNSWVAQLRAALQTKYGVYGDYFSAWGLTPTAGFGNPSGTTPYGAITSGGYAESGFGRANTSTQTAGWFQTFTCPYNATGFDIVFVDYPAGTWQFDIDGGLGGTPTVTVTGTGASVSAGASTYTVTNAGVNNVGNTAVRKVTVRGLTAGQHVIRVGQQSAAGVLHLNGFNVYSGNTGGVFCSWIGLPSASSCDWTTWRGTANGAGSRISTPTDKIALISGQYSNLNVSPYGVSNAPFGYPSAPHLLVTDWGINDTASGTSVGSYRRAMRRFIQSARRGADACSWMHVAPAYGDSEYADNSIAGRGPLYPTYKYAAADVARSFGGAYVDIDAKWGELALTKGFQSSGNLHPTDAGATDIYNTLNPLVVI